MSYDLLCDVLEVQLKSAEEALNREGDKQIKHNCPL
jgi:hypothetical protein